MNMEGADASTSDPAPVTPLSLPPFIESPDVTTPAPVTPLSLRPFTENSDASTLAPGPATAEEENSRYQATSELFPFPQFPRSFVLNPPIMESGDASTSVRVRAPVPVTVEEENTRYQDIINKIQLALPKLSRYNQSTSQLLPFLPFQSENATTSVPAPAPAPATAEEENTRYQDIINNIQLALEKLEKSSFCAEFMKHVQNPEIAAEIERVIATDPQQYSKLQLVLYGVGEMERSDYTRNVEVCHMQLALAILLREKFQWVNDIVVYDPIMSPLQQKAISAFNCTFLPVNEYGRRTVDRPTLFFMPRCPINLVDNVLAANWTTANLNKIIILGDSFMKMKREDTHEMEYKLLRRLKHLMAIIHSDNVLREMSLPQQEGVYIQALHDFSWHFFTLDGSIEDLNLAVCPEVTQSSSHLGLQ